MGSIWILILETIFVSGLITGCFGVKCRNCYEMVQSNTCNTDNPDTCDGDYCTFLNITMKDQKAQVIYKCSKNPKLAYGGDSNRKEYTKMNECTKSSIGDDVYLMKVCNNKDECNTDCRIDNSTPIGDSAAAPGACVTLLLMSTALMVFKAKMIV